MIVTRTKSTGLTDVEIESMVDDISRINFDGNVYARASYRRGALTFTLAVHDSRGKGARRSASGRRLTSACWHAHLHALAEIFEFAPGVTVRTALATYQGLESFNDLFPMTKNVNVGSAFEPVRFGDLCDCDN